MQDRRSKQVEVGVQKAITILIEERPDDLVNRSKDYSAILVILKHKGISQRLRNDVIRDLVLLYEKTRDNFLPNSDALGIARSLVRYGASNATAERVAKNMIYAAWYDSIEDFIRTYCDRDLTGEEIFALTESYITNKASRCESDEALLYTLAKKYLHDKDVEMLHSCIKAFNNEWNNYID